MRIAQVAPLYESVPPRSYGGTERIVSYLTEELVRLGHEVTLFASGDSSTAARLVAPCPQSLRLSEEPVIDALAHHMWELELVAREIEAGRFDVVHYHTDYFHFSLSRRLPTPHVTTLHGKLNIPDLYPLYQGFPEVPLVSISDAQREPLGKVNWRGTVYHGLPEDLYQYYDRPEGYLAFLGRICPEKRPDRAIAIARRAGLPLKLAAKVDPVDEKYYEEEIKPLLDQPGIEFIGEIGEDRKSEFLGNAAALLFPIDWPEPFGLVLIEALAGGTPVIAYRHGSVPEVIEDGRTGFIVNDEDEAVAAVGRLKKLSRRGCRERFEERFSVREMAQRYLRIYDELPRSGPAGG